MKSLTLRRTLLCLIVLGSLVGCKRVVEPVDVVDENEMALTAKRPSAITPQSALYSGSSTLDEFENGSAIGLFVQLKSESDRGSEVVIKRNAHYNYAQPVWTPQAKEDKLLYHEAEPVYIFGYYPHPSVIGATTTIKADQNVVDFKLSTDQSSVQALKISDLLWVAAKNENSKGYSRQRQPINLEFTHRLTKVSFYVKLIDSKPTVESPKAAYLRSIETIGRQIASDATLNVLSGQIKAVYPTDPSYSGTVKWESTSEKGTKLTVGAEPVLVTDMLLIPFEAQTRENWFRHLLYFEEANLEQNFTAYIPQYDPAAGDNAAGKLRFESNKHNKITVTIDISDSYMNISSVILPWGEGSTVELPSEKD